MILLVLIVLPKNHDFLHFPLHTYLFIIQFIIGATSNLGKVNHVTKWFSNCDPQFHSDF